MRIRATVVVAFIIIGTFSLHAQQQTPLGQGCISATYIDKDCDGYGVGKKSSGVYPIGKNTTYTTGDLPDADDEDATVNTTASWETKWSGSIAAFLAARKGFTNTSRIYYVSASGSDSTGVVNDKTHPYRTPKAARLAFHDLQGGVIVVRGGTTDADFSACGNGGACYSPTGTSTKPVYIMAYPGEKVETPVVFTHVTQYWPNANFRYVTFDGFTWTSANYNMGDAFKLIDTDHITIRNCEFAGWHQTFFGNHTEDVLIEQNVFHDMATHAIYFGSVGMTSYGAADFDFTDDAAKYLAGTSPGASYRGRILNNVIYSSGSSGYEAVHVNTYTRDNLIEGNIISYAAGGIGLQSGVYYTVVRNNAIFDNGRAGITLSLYGPGTQAATIRYITIENNTIWAGLHTDSIRSTNPSYAIAANDYGTADGHWIKDVTVRNNVMVTDNYSATSGNPPLSFQRNSYPNTWTIQNNQFWSVAASPADHTMTITNTAYPNGQDAGNYNFTQFQAYAAGFGNNLYSDPKLKAASVRYTTTPWLFDLSLSENSPAIRAGTIGTAAVDIRRTVRALPLDIGAYAYGRGTPPAAPKNVNLKR